MKDVKFLRSKLFSSDKQGIHKSRWIRPGDFIVLGLIVIIIIFLLTLQNKAGTDKVLIIEQDGKVIYSRDMNSLVKTETFRITSPFELEVEFTKDYAVVLHSECPDRLCEKAGKLTKVGDTSICLPAHLSVRISGKSELKIDGITG